MITPNDLELVTLLLAVLLLVGVKRFASRLSDDLYDGGKRWLRALARRMLGLFNSAPPALTSPPTLAPPGEVMPTPTLPSPAPSPPGLTPPQAQYHAIQALTVGDIATLYRATGASGSVVIKLASEPADNPWLQNEADTLRALVGEAKQYGQHLPTLRDQFRTQDNRLANVLAPCDGYDLVALRQRFPQGVEPQHVIWIFRRVLSVLGYVHEQGILHGNIEPAHIIVRPQDHNVWLVDWCYAITRPRETGATFRALNTHYSAPEVAERKAPLPAADLYSLGLTMLYLLGGDPARQTFPPSVPERLQRFIQFFLKPSAIQRPQEAWKMAHVLETIRTELFGAHHFVEFKVDREPLG